ncbi:hypothetical protein [uncultured Corynebacterium sp.]|uniref:hypothetical protein n=1 Tax=uncultured Corynebacterium sp. TaxID=159447 RepID=UPI002622E6AF|nr:hypothetical protein [uncultured Corynebacterium sp.]
MAFFFSRRNMVGMLLAVVVVMLHLVLGLGFLWPVAALAAWGAGALLTPPEKENLRAVPRVAREVPGERLRPTEPDDLRRYLDRDVRRWERRRLPPAITDALTGAYSNLVDALGKWDRLDSSTRHRVIVQHIVTDDLPDVMDGYLAIPREDRTRAEADVVSLLGLLAAQAEEALEEARAAFNAELHELDEKRLRMELQYGALPELKDGPELTELPELPAPEPAPAPEPHDSIPHGPTPLDFNLPDTAPIPEPQQYNPFDPTANLPPVSRDGEPWDLPRGRRNQRRRGDGDGA